VAYLLYHQYQCGLVLKYQQQTTGIINFKLNQYVEECVTLPSRFTEQSKIAEVLSTVDRAIEQTEALIAKQERIKTGLMQDLLTRGIDEHGNLRSESTHKFKDSPLGRIPIEWEVLPLGNLLSGIDAGWSPNCEGEPPSQGEWGILKVSAISSGVFKPSESKRLAAGLLPIPSLEVRQRDVLVSRANGVAELVGRCVLVEHTPSRLMLSDKTLRLVPRPDTIRPFILTASMSSHHTRLQIGTLFSGSSGQKNITQKQLRTLLIAVAKWDEQMMAERAVVGAVENIAQDNACLEKLKALKIALMQDLLTGKKRVTPLLG
jgi:type I restriction enzyme S subunit